MWFYSNLTTMLLQNDARIHVRMYVHWNHTIKCMHEKVHAYIYIICTYMYVKEK